MYYTNTLVLGVVNKKFTMMEGYTSRAVRGNHLRVVCNCIHNSQEPIESLVTSRPK